MIVRFRWLRGIGTLITRTCLIISWSPVSSKSHLLIIMAMFTNSYGHLFQQSYQRLADHLRYQPLVALANNSLPNLYNHASITQRKNAVLSTDTNLLLFASPSRGDGSRVHHLASSTKVGKPPAPGAHLLHSQVATVSAVGERTRRTRLLHRYPKTMRAAPRSRENLHLRSSSAPSTAVCAGIISYH